MSFSFYLDGFCNTKVNDLSLPYYLSIAGGRIVGFIPFPSSIFAIWNPNKQVQDLNTSHSVHFPRWLSLHTIIITHDGFPRWLSFVIEHWTYHTHFHHVWVTRRKSPQEDQRRVLDQSYLITASSLEGMMNFANPFFRQVGFFDELSIVARWWPFVLWVWVRGWVRGFLCLFWRETLTKSLRASFPTYETEGRRGKARSQNWEQIWVNASQGKATVRMGWLLKRC